MQTLPMKGMQGMYFSSFKKSKAFQNLLMKKMMCSGDREEGTAGLECVCFYLIFYAVLGISMSLLLG